MNWGRYYQLRLKLLAVVIIVALLFVFILTYISFRETKKIIISQMDIYGNSLAEIIATSSIDDLLSWNYPVTQDKINHIGKNNPQIVKIEIYHQQALSAEYLSDSATKKDSGEIDSNKQSKSYEFPISHYVESTQELINLGSVKVVLSKKEYDDFLFREQTKVILLSVILLIVNMVLLYLIMKWILLTPLENIMMGVKNIGIGNLKYRIDIKNRDEMGLLAKTINVMAENLQRSRSDIKKRTNDLEKAREDLTENLQKTELAKARVEAERNKTASIIANFIDPVMVIDGDDRLILFNPSAKQIFKLSESDLGKKIMTEKQKECSQYVFCLNAFKNFFRTPYSFKVIEADKDKHPVIEELVVGDDKNLTQKKHNGQMIFKVLTSSIKDSKGNHYGYMKIFYDLTREKLIDRMKSDFISLAAHQLRTPLSGMKWSLYSLLKENKNFKKIGDEGVDYLNRIYDTNEKVIKLVDSLLDVSHIEEGRFIGDLKTCLMADVVKEVIQSLAILAEKKNIEIILENQEKWPLKIRVDIEKFKLAIQNLIENSIKYSLPNKKIFVIIKIRNEKGKKFALIEIKDQGIGIRMEDQQKLFTKFFRSSNAVKMQTEGSGLGLFIVKNIIEAHQGRVWLESEENKGTTFYIEVPAMADEVK